MFVSSLAPKSWSSRPHTVTLWPTSYESSLCRTPKRPKSIASGLTLSKLARVTL